MLKIALVFHYAKNCFLPLFSFLQIKTFADRKRKFAIGFPARLPFAVLIFLDFQSNCTVPSFFHLCLKHLSFASSFGCHNMNICVNKIFAAVANKPDSVVKIGENGTFFDKSRIQIA